MLCAHSSLVAFQALAKQAKKMLTVACILVFTGGLTKSKA